MLGGLVLLAALLWPGAAGARWVDLGGGPVEVRLLDADGGRSVLEITVGGFEAIPVEIAGQTYYRLAVEGATVQEEAGCPALPDVRRSVIIPDDQDVAVRVLSREQVDLPGMPIAPSKGHLPRTIDPASVPYRFGPVYASGALYPETLAAGEEPYILRDWRGAVIDANLFQYDPAARTLRVTTRLVLEVAPSGPATVNPLERPGPLTRMDPQFAQLYERHFVNYGFDGTRYTPVLEDGGLLIITYDAFRSAVEPLYEWKLQKGMPAKLVNLSEIGAGTAEIQACIAAAYDTLGIAYVLLVGDAPHVPTIPYRNGSDPSYSLITADDYPDLFIGRFSADDLDDVATQVERTIAYERDVTAAESWMQRGAVIASAEGEGRGHFGESDIVHENQIRDDLLAYGYALVDTIYDPDAVPDQVLTSLKAGRGNLNYTGHGNMNGWSTSDLTTLHIPLLRNHDELPFICSVACENGKFTAGTCFAEAWLRATDEGRPTGAIATYMSTINQSWAPPMDAQDEAVDLLLADRMRTIGGLWFNSACLMIERNDSTGVKEFKCWTIFGDPSLMVRTREPQPLTLLLADTLLTGEASYALSVPGVAGARCALYGDGVLHGFALTDSNGEATIPLAEPLLEPRVLRLTVTAFNHETRVEEIRVLPVDQPLLVLREVACTDGSGDGILNAGESAELRVALENLGRGGAVGVSGRLSSSHARVTLLADSLDFPDIAPDTFAWGDSCGILAIAPDCPDGEEIALALRIRAAGGHAWDEEIRLLVSAPVIELAEILVDDTRGGNGNGRLDAGDSADVVLTLHNAGSYPLDSLLAVLTCGEPLITVVAGEAGHAGLARDSSGVLGPALRVFVDPVCERTDAPFELAVSGSFGYATVLPVRLPIGGYQESAEAGALGWSHAVVLPGFGDQWHLSAERNHTPGGSASWKCGDEEAGSYANLLDAGLTSPPLELDGTGELRFWQWIEAEVSATFAGRAYDGGLIEISIDGAPFTQITPEGGYPFTIRPSAEPGPFAGDTPVFSGTADWHPVTFDLSGIVGTVVLRWRFGSDGAVSGGGWFIDDIEVLGLNFFSATEPGDPRPTRLALAPARPNPIFHETEIAFELPAGGAVRLQIFDAGGRLVRTLADEPLAAGRHSFHWRGETQSGERAASGRYYCRLRTGQGEQSRALTLLR